MGRQFLHAQMCTSTLRSGRASRIITSPNGIVQLHGYLLMICHRTSWTISELRYYKLQLGILMVSLVGIVLKKGRKNGKNIGDYGRLFRISTRYEARRP